MKPTPRGLKTIIIMTLLLTLSILFSDIMLTVCFLILVILVSAALLDLVKKVRKVKRTVIEPSTLDLKLVAGSEGKAFIKFRSEAVFKIDVEKSWISFQPEIIDRPETVVTLSIKPTLSGVYELLSLKTKVYDFFKFFQASLELPIQLRLKAYPRVYPWILEALSLLEEMGAGAGDHPGKRRGRGLEYLWSREYQVGDDISFIDWKASARHRKIYVKEFLEESYGSAKIIYDVRAHGPITGDECSAYFLSTVIFALREGLQISIMVKNGSNVIIDRNDLNPSEALKLALAYVLEHYLTNRWSVYELFEPKSAHTLLKISREIGSKAFMKITELRLSDFLKYLSKFFEEGKKTVIYVGCILIDSDFVKNLVTEFSNLGGNVIVLSPLKPWLDAKNLEEAYLMHQSHEKLLKVLENMKVDTMPRPFRSFLT
ncbi:MAG: DUF58 domain-containing protein [Nitrososphaerota archaeon]